ncbi:MAG: type IV pilin protein [Candidatus Saccharimonadaceae bacterium]
MTFLDKQSKGFTIVELLIVVVVIAILAAITIVSYNGISTRARQAAMQSTLEQITKQVHNYKTINSMYPTSLGLLNNGQGPNTSTDTLLAYTLEGSDDFCITIASNSNSDRYYTCGSSGKITAGTYTTHTGILAGFPTRDGYTNISDIYGTGDTVRADISSIATGSWMILVFTYNYGVDPVTPAGWTPLTVRKNTSTLNTTVYAKIKQAGDSAYYDWDSPGTSGAPNTNAVLLWGSNSAPVSSWTMGTYGDRSVNATSTTVLTPTVNVTTTKSLVLSLATERTSVMETNYTSLVGATPWIWIPQEDPSNKIQTIAIGYNEQANVGTSQAMTVTYPNNQSLNGTGVQVVIPSIP